MTKLKHRVLYITGSRADFGRAKYLLDRIQKDRNYELDIIVTGMHLLNGYGHTLEEIETEFHVEERINSIFSLDSPSAMAQSFGIELLGFAQTIERLKPDLIILLGDRGEMLAGAIVGKHLNIPIAHIGGGHVSGSIDDKLRDAITVFSDYHFVSNQVCYKRVKELGANEKNIFIVGTPDLEIILRKDYPNADLIYSKYKIKPKEPLMLVSFHPVINEFYKVSDQIMIICDIIEELKYQTIITYPNTDAGGTQIIKCINELQSNKFIKIFNHIPYNDYLGLMNVANVLIGNSSAGIIEAPSLHLPVINIGTRQLGRERADNVIDVDFEKKEIIEAINIALFDKKFKNRVRNTINPYGNNQPSEIMYSYLKQLIKNGN
jgi:GDP/UDP-N,N'-diacetylbacillosamine 2-epimerase (hydrolysing)